MNAPTTKGLRKPALRRAARDVVRDDGVESFVCESSNVELVEYRRDDETVRVTFRNGGAYEYAPIDAETWESLCCCDSVGAFVSSHLRGKERAA